MQNSPPDPCQKFRLLNNFILLISFSIVLIDFLILRFHWHDLSMRFTKFCNFYHVFPQTSPTIQVFLEVLPGDLRQWVPVTQENRQRYSELKSHYVVDPHETEDMSLTVNNPLSQEEKVFSLSSVL